MHVPFRIPYRNNLIDKKDSYPIPRPPSWDDRNCSYGHRLYPSECISETFHICSFSMIQSMYNVKYHLLLHVYKYFCEWKQKKTTCIVCHFNYLFLIFISLKIKGEIIYMYKLLPVFFKLKPDASVCPE
jgi:hypothetical protein